MHENNTKDKWLSLYKDSMNLAFKDIKGVDVVEIHDEDLDWLRDFCNTNYTGEQMPFFSKRFVIKVKAGNRAMLLYVRYLDDDHYQVDAYPSKDAERAMWTEIIQNTCVCDADGRLVTVSYTVPWFAKYKSSETMELVEYLQNVTKYVIFYIHKNKDRVEKKTVFMPAYSSKKKKKGGGKSRSKSNEKTIYIPKKIVSVVVKDDAVNVESVAEPMPEEESTTAVEVTESASNSEQSKSKREYNGYTEEWVSKAHTRRIKDKKTGQVRIIQVRASTKRRSQDLLDRGSKKQKRIILKPQSGEEES